MASNFRASVEKAQEYELPSQYRRNDDAEGLDEDLTRRYHKARNAYIQQRCQQVFYEHLSTYDGNTLELPEQLTPEDMQHQQAIHDEATQQLVDTTQDMNRQMQILESKYAHLVSRRQGLVHLVDDMEKETPPMDKDDNDEDDDLDVSEEEMVLEEQRLAELTKKRNELQAKLRSITLETEQAELSTQNYALSVNEMQLARGAQVSDERVESPTSTTDVHLASTEELQAKTAELQAKVAALEDMRDWYDEMCVSIEGVSGIQIKNVDKNESGGLVLVLVLRHEHEMQIVLSPKPNSDDLRVTAAKFLSDTLVSSPSVNEQDQDDHTAVVQMRIPQPDDLVDMAKNMGPMEDLAFLLRETQARMDAAVAKVNEIALLRTKYLTNIQKSYLLDFGFGSKYQEIVCSLNMGLTIILHLGPDCPMVQHSVHIKQIVGSGGWDASVVERLKDTVNAKPGICGPIQLMDALLGEIKRMEQEENLSIPKTPKLPERRKA